MSEAKSENMSEAKTATGGMAFPMEITLKSPVTVDGKKLAVVTIREPRGRDWKRWGGEPEGVKRTMGLLCDLSGQPEACFDEMVMDDHARCIGVAEAFFARYQPEGNGLIKLLMTSPSVSAGLLKQLSD